MTSDDLDTRIAALERRVPVDAPPPDLAPARRRARRRAIALVVAPVLVLAIAATAVAGAGIAGFYTITVSGPTDPALIGAGLECMTPPEAAAWLASHGHDQVVWDTFAASQGVAPAILGPAVDGTSEQGTLEVGLDPAGSPGVLEQGTIVAGGGADVTISGPVPADADRMTVTTDANGPAPDGSPMIAITMNGGGSAQGTVGATTPPAEGVVLVGTVTDGVLHMVVDTTPGATRPATCPAK